jgi:hypothetical protein
VIVQRAKLQTTGTIFNKQTQLIAYAVDIDTVGRSLVAVRNACLALGAEAAKVGLKISEQKPKYMITAGNKTTPDKLWLLATIILKSSTNLCTWELL